MKSGWIDEPSPPKVCKVGKQLYVDCLALQTVRIEMQFVNIFKTRGAMLQTQRGTDDKSATISRYLLKWWRLDRHFKCKRITTEKHENEHVYDKEGARARRASPQRAMFSSSPRISRMWDVGWKVGCTVSASWLWVMRSQIFANVNQKPLIILALLTRRSRVEFNFKQSCSVHEERVELNYIIQCKRLNK